MASKNISVKEVIEKLLQKNDVSKDTEYIQLLGKYNEIIDVKKDETARKDKGKKFVINVPNENIIDFKVNKSLFRTLTSELNKQYKNISFMFGGIWSKNLIACLESIYNQISIKTKFDKDNILESIFKFNDDKSGILCFPQYVNLKIKEAKYLDIPFTYRINEKLKDQDYDSFVKVIDQVVNLINTYPDNDYYLVPKNCIMFTDVDENTSKMYYILKTKFVLNIIVNNIESDVKETNNIFVKTNYLTPFQFMLRNDVFNLESDIKKIKSSMDIDSYPLLSITDDLILNKYCGIFNVDINKVKSFKAGSIPSNRENWNNYLKSDIKEEEPDVSGITLDE